MQQLCGTIGFGVIMEKVRLEMQFESLAAECLPPTQDHVKYGIDPEG